MTPLNLEEFAQGLRLSGNWREQEFATEILDLLDLETDVAEPYEELCGDIEHATPRGLRDAMTPAQQLERLTDRCAMLDEIETLLAEANRLTGANGKPLDFVEAVEALIADLPDPEPTPAPPITEYDL